MDCVNICRLIAFVYRLVTKKSDITVTIDDALHPEETQTNNIKFLWGVRSTRSYRDEAIVFYRRENDFHKNLHSVCV